MAAETTPGRPETVREDPSQEVPEPASIPGRERVRRDAAARDLAVEIFARKPADSLAEAAAVLGIRPADIVKSLVVKRPDDTFLFALIPGDRQISWPKLRAVLGVNRLSMPSAQVARQATGYERGTITPLGSTTAWPVFADSAMLGQRVAMGAGEHGFSLFVQADDLITALDATVLDISDPA
ncbi:MAG TPA: YbaK/EbsC family protein [Micrococcaceae bacterium]|jgi:Cys-tRNA(Pro)/Cys-tRNA(Cys) deacylase|nr:YbaK/EbsC family protein [Micrococcaceae bacterium]